MSAFTALTFGLAVLSARADTAKEPSICSMVTPAGSRFMLVVRRGDAATVSFGGLTGEANPAVETQRNGRTYAFVQDGINFDLDIDHVQDERGVAKATLSGTRDRSHPMIVSFGFCGRQAPASQALTDVNPSTLLSRANWPDHCFALIGDRLVIARYTASTSDAKYQDAELGEVSLKRSQIQLPAPPYGSVSFHIAGVGNKPGQMDLETATYDSDTGEVVIALQLTKDADPRLASSRYMVCGSKSVKVQS